MDLNWIKQDMGHTWKWLAEGWRSVFDKAANALTYFSPVKVEAEADAEAGLRWGLMAADVSQDNHVVVVALETPGLEKDEIDIEVESRRLVVTGHKNYAAERKEGSLVVSERAFGRFQRVIPLPDEVTPEGAKARYRGGVLTVRLQKAAKHEVRKVKVVSG